MGKVRLTWIQVYENERLKKVKGYLIGGWAMRPYLLESSSAYERMCNKSPTVTPLWEFWHVDSGLKCNRGPGPEDIVFDFLDQPSIVKIGQDMSSKRLGRPRIEALFDKVMFKWHEFSTNAESSEYKSLPCPMASTEIGRIREILNVTKNYPIEVEEARLLADAIRKSPDGYVATILEEYAEECEVIRKARHAHSTRWGEQSWDRRDGRE